LDTKPLERSYYANPLFVYLYIALAVMMIPLLFLRGSSPLLGSNIVILISVAIMFKVKPLAVIYDDYMTYRPAPIRGQKFLRYSDISEINVKGKKLFVTVNNGAPLKIHLNSFSSDDRDTLVRTLRTRQKA